MKKYLFFIMVIFLFSCNSNQGVKIENGQVQVKLKRSQLNGDLTNQDISVFKALKGMSGVYSVILTYDVVDNYGNITDKNVIVGSIDVDKLNNYQDVSYWLGSTGGVSRMIHVYFLPH